MWTNETLIALLTALLGGGGLVTALAAWRRDAKKGPIDAQTAKVADAVAVSEVATGWVQYQDEKMRDQDAKIASLALKLDSVSTLVQEWDTWYMDLDVRWPYHRNQSTPPRPPRRSPKIVHNKENE